MRKRKNPVSTSGRLVVLPYVKWLSETSTRIMKKYERTCAFKPGNTLGQQLFRLKDMSNAMKMAGGVYKVQCKDYSGSYISEISQLLYVRLKEHRTEWHWLRPELALASRGKALRLMILNQRLQNVPQLKITLSTGTVLRRLSRYQIGGWEG